MNPRRVEVANVAGGTYPGKAMEIRISIQTSEPLTGTARTESRGPLPFDGWLELLHVLSTLISTQVDSAGGKPAPAHDAPSQDGGRDGHANDGAVDDEPIQG